MYKNISLSASIMCIDWINVGQQLIQIEENDIDYLHIDVIDGNFAPDFTMGSSIIDSIINNTNLPCDYHMMVEEPSRFYDTFNIKKNYNYCIHQESSRNLHRNIINLKKFGCKVGIALSPGTPLTTLDYIIEEIDFVIIMTVNPGYKGQSLIPQGIRKVADLKELIKKFDLKVKICVDGNVNSLTIPDMIAAGADTLVLGSSGLFRKDLSIKNAIIEIKNSIDKGLDEINI